MRKPMCAVALRFAAQCLAICLCSGAGPMAAADQTSAQANAASAPMQTQAAAKADYNQRLICKREHITGSMIMKKTCRTQAQIDAELEASKQFLRDVNRSAGSPGPAQ